MESKLDEVTSKLEDEWINLHVQRPKILYHYTTAQGLLGVLESGRLWATNSRFMNDTSEIGYATTLFRDVVTTEVEKFQSPKLGKLQKTVIGWLDEYEKDAKVYVACFCMNGDLLSQWRGYGAAGGGFSIGFLADRVGHPALTSLDKPNPILRKVIYRPSVQKRLIRERITALCELELVKLKSPQRHKVQQAAYAAWMMFSLFLSEALNCFKDPAYEEEQEWRIIQHGRNYEGKDTCKISFRSNGGRIIPYTILNFTASGSKETRGHLPIKIIGFGPTLNPNITQRSLRLLCDAHGYGKSEVTIKRSGIPFSP